jgi:undecaprenyl-diphosphatase
MIAYLVWQYARQIWLRWGLVAISIGTIFMVGLSRIYLGFHFVTDVLGGWILGAGLVGGIWLACDFIFCRHLHSTR